MADPQPQSPMWWLQKLEGELHDRQPRLQLMDAYYRGDHPMPFLTKAHNAKMRDEFRQLLDDCRANYMRLVVDATEERMRVEGFRLSPDTDPVADAPSWKIWQASDMDSLSQAAFVEALVKEVSYLSVWFGDKTGDPPTIAVEDPTQTIVGYVPGSNYTKRAAALKIWLDDWTGLLRANVYMPDGIYKYQAPIDDKSSPGTYPQLAGTYGEAKPKWVDWQGGEAYLDNPVGIVPIIPLRNRPRVLCEGESELIDVYRIQNQINGFLFLLALAGYFGAHKQRWAVGLKIMEDSNGKPIEPFDVDAGKLWVAQQGADGQDVKFGEFSQTDLSGYIKAIEQKVLQIVTTSRTPRHYLFQEGQSPSGDAIQSAESGLVKKVERKQRDFGEALEETMALAMRFNGEQAPPVDSEIVWADPRTESPGVLTDAVIKQYAGGLIPWEAALEKLGYSQTQIQRFSKMRLSDALMKGVEADQGVADPAPPAPVQVKGPIIRA